MTCLRGVADLRDDNRLEIALIRRLLLALQTRLRQPGLGRARPDRVAQIERHAPRLEVVGEHVAQRVGKAALGLTENGRGKRRRIAVELELRPGNALDVVIRP